MDDQKLLLANVVLGFAKLRAWSYEKIKNGLEENDWAELDVWITATKNSHDIWQKKLEARFEDELYSEKSKLLDASEEELDKLLKVKNESELSEIDDFISNLEPYESEFILPWRDLRIVAIMRVARHDGTGFEPIGFEPGERPKGSSAKRQDKGVARLRARWRSRVRQWAGCINDDAADPEIWRDIAEMKGLSINIAKLLINFDRKWEAVGRHQSCSSDDIAAEYKSLIHEFKRYRVTWERFNSASPEPFLDYYRRGAKGEVRLTQTPPPYPGSPEA